MYYDSLLYKHKKDIFLALTLFFVYVCIYGYMSLRLGIGTEEAYAIAGESGDVYIANGRWGIYLYRKFSFIGPISYGAGIVAGIYLSIALILQIKILELKSLWGSLIFGLMYLSCIQWAYQLRYSNQSDVIALGILCISWAVYLLKHNGWRYFLISTILITLAISIYQSLCIYVTMLTLLLCLYKYINTNNFRLFQWGLRVISIILSSLLLYFLIKYLIISLSDIPAEYLEYIKEYQKGMTGHEQAIESDVPMWIIIGHYIKESLLNEMFGFAYRGQWIMNGAYIAGVLLILKIAHNKTNHIKKIISLMLLGTIYVLPYSLTTLLMHVQQLRTFMAEPLLLAGTWAICIPYIDQMKWRKLQHLITLMSGCFFISAIYNTSLIAGHEAYAFNRAKEELLTMYNRARTIAINENLGDCRIVILGYLPNIPKEHLYLLTETGIHNNQASPYILRQGVWAQQYIDFMRLFGMKSGTKEDINYHQKVYQQMPTWPKHGSVCSSRGEVIIKIGPTLTN